MTCTNCGAVNETGAEFCEACGIRLGSGNEVVSQPTAMAQAETAAEPAAAAPEPAAAAPEPARPAPKMLTGAGVGVRFVATIIDTVILVWICSLVTAPFEPVTISMGYGLPLKGTTVWVSILVFFVYYLAMERWLGGTVGKLLLGLRVVMADGTKVTFEGAAIRTILRFIDILPIFIPYICAAILVWRSPSNQRFGDRIGKTLVVNRNVYSGLGL